MLRSTPFLLFDGNCAEAMTFYHQCLGGKLTLTKLGDSPNSPNCFSSFSFQTRKVSMRESTSSRAISYNKHIARGRVSLAQLRRFFIRLRPLLFQ